MRIRLARICLLTSALLLTPALASGQGKQPAAAAAKKGDPKKGDAKDA
jgi:hypothetical protein